MRNKLIGAVCCVLLVFAALIALWLSGMGGFYHQHKEESSVQNELDLDSGEWTVREVDSRDFLLRNYVFCNLAGDLSGYAPITKYVPDGSGKMVQISQTMKTALKDKAVFAVCLEPKEVETEDIPVIEPLSVYRHLVKSDREIRLVLPDSPSEETADSIQLELSCFEKTLYSYDFDSKAYGYDTYMDGESFIRYFLVTELARPLQPEQIRFCLFKNDEGKYCIFATDFLDSAEKPEEDFALAGAMWYSMLLKDERFVTGIVNEYHSLRKTRFSEEYLNEYIRQASGFIDSCYGEEGSTKEEAKRLEAYLEQRLKWMDANIESLYQHAAKSNIKNYTDDPY